MTKRPESHVSGDRAVNRVMGICLSVGWACERVASDYGEDICAQTAYQQKVDPYRVFFQVKGTKLLSDHIRGTKLSITVSKEHILRWIRSPDPVVLVLWDLVNDTGYYAVPRHQFTEYDLYSSNSKTLQLMLDKENRFDQQSASKLDWEFRISFYTHLLSEARNQDAMVKSYASKEDKTEHKSRVPLITIDFLRLVGVVYGSNVNQLYLDSQFVTYFQNTMIGLKSTIADSELTNDDLNRIIKESIMFALLGKVNDGKCALPLSLITECTFSIAAVMRAIGMFLPDDLFDENTEQANPPY